MAGATDIVQQLPQLEALCERLYNSQVGTPSLQIPRDKRYNIEMRTAFTA